MRQWFLIGLCTSLLACQSSLPRAPQLPPITWQQINTQTAYVSAQVALSDASNAGFTSNVTWLRAASQTWWIGSGSSEMLASALLAALKEKNLDPPTHILSPRAHPESVLGAGFVKDTQHVAWTEVERAMKARCPTCAAKFREAIDPHADPNRIGLPQPLAPGPWGGLQIMALKRAPGEWTSAVQHGDVLVAPGLVWGLGIVPELREAAVHELLASLEQLDAMSFATVVPEQGAAGHRNMLKDNLSYWKNLHREVCLALTRGHTLGERLAAPSSALDGINEKDTAKQYQRLNGSRHSLNLQRHWLMTETRWLEKADGVCD